MNIKINVLNIYLEIDIYYFNHNYYLDDNCINVVHQEDIYKDVNILHLRNYDYIHIQIVSVVINQVNEMGI